MMEKKTQAMRIWLLGGFRVSVGPRMVRQGDWRLKKARSLVKLLALAPGHRMHREHVTDLLWPDSGSKAQANNLRQALHAARHALNPAPAAVASERLRLLGEQLALCSEGDVWVDAEAFAAAAARRALEPAAYWAAVGLYTGELLPEDRYEGWAEEKREGLRYTYLSLLVELAGLYEEREDFQAAAEALRRVLGVEPTHEEANVGLMRLYSLMGRQHEALLQYERLHKGLSEKLGAEPGAASRQLYEELRAGRTLGGGGLSAAEEDRRDPEVPTGPGRHNLPAERTSFVRREEETVEVRRHLAMTRLLTLTGAGGLGKTRFALEVARGLAGTYPDGAWLVELASLSDPELVERAHVSCTKTRSKPSRSRKRPRRGYFAPVARASQEDRAWMPRHRYSLDR